MEEKLDVINHTEKEEWNCGHCRNVRLAHSSICTICDSADRNNGSAKWLDNKCQQSQTGSFYLCSKTTTVLSE
jgi:hypothetical protein